MAQYALVDGFEEPQPVKALGQRARCHDKQCNWTMVAKPGNGKVLPHWAHMPGSACAQYPANGEKGEWHREVQSLFIIYGARTEVRMPSADGSREHVADVVCADGRIIEAQTHYLAPEELTSREATYGTMCWLYDAWDTHAWFIIDRDPGRFTWGKPDRRFFTHARPIYFDTPDGVWHLTRLTVRHVGGGKGRPVYEGVRRKVANSLLEFVQQVSGGQPFLPPALLAGIDPRQNNRGTRNRQLMPVDDWLAANPECHYDPINYPSPPPAAPNGTTETDWSKLAGLRCNCRPKCTDVVWGDAGICHPECEPCRIMAGTTYTRPNAKKVGPE